MSDLSRVPVVFRDSSAACVYFQPPNEGWEIVSDAQQCDVSTMFSTFFDAVMTVFCSF